MAGIKLTIPGAFTDNTLPVLRADSVLPARGALLLLDATSPAGPWPSGIANNTVLPNVAGDQAQALTGTRSNGRIEYAGSVFSLSRSSKGGIKVTPATADPVALGNYFRVTANDLRDYLHRNTNHGYFMSQWGRPGTVPAPAANTPHFTAAYGNGGSGLLAALTRNGTNLGTYPNTGLGPDKFLGSVGGALQDNKPYLHQLGVSGWYGVVPELAGGLVTQPFMWGRTGWGPSEHVPITHTFYRAYLEDLTVSGRTFAQAAAADLEAYTREVLTPGGRYYGDY